MTYNIAFTFSDLYAPYAQVLTYSIIRNNRDLDLKFFYIIDPNFDNKKKISFEQTLEIFKKNFPKSDFEIIPFPKDLDNYLLKTCENFKYSRYTTYRCYLDQILPREVDSVLYLDCDSICDGKLDELFQYYENYQTENPQNSKIIFAPLIPTIDAEDFIQKFHLKGYFCSSTLLFNLKNWRSNKQFQTELLNELDKIGEITEQDALNIVCHNDFHKNISLIYDYEFRYDFIDPKPNPIIYAYNSNSGLCFPKTFNTQLWAKILIKLGLYDFSLVASSIFLSIFSFDKNKPSWNEIKQDWHCRRKAKKVYSKYYKPYLKLVKDNN